MFFALRANVAIHIAGEFALMVVGRFRVENLGGHCWAEIRHNYYLLNLKRSSPKTGAPEPQDWRDAAQSNFVQERQSCIQLLQLACHAQGHEMLMCDNICDVKYYTVSDNLCHREKERPLRLPSPEKSVIRNSADFHPL